MLDRTERASHHRVSTRANHRSGDPRSPEFAAVIDRMLPQMSSGQTGRMRHNLARGGPMETTQDPASMVGRWRRSSRSKSPSTAQNLSASLVSGARCWGTSYRRHRRGSLRGTISIARCRLSVRVQRSHALIPQVWARLHLDVRVGTGLVGDERLAVLEAECARLVALGAVRVRLLRADGYDESCLVMQDIEGNEFCLD
jgi:hypothetical protein